MKIKLFMVVVLASFTHINAAAEDSPETVCKSAAELYADGDTEGALEEARWCVTLMEQEQQGKVNSFFLDEVDGYKGAQLESQNAMGFTVITRRYNKGDDSLTVSLNAGNSGSTMHGAISALAQLGLGGASGKKMRIQKRAATATFENGTARVLVTLRSGGVLTFESNNMSLEALIAFARRFPIADLDEARA